MTTKGNAIYFEYRRYWNKTYVSKRHDYYCSNWYNIYYADFKSYKTALLNRRNKKRIELSIQLWQRRETPYISYSVPIGKRHVSRRFDYYCSNWYNIYCTPFKSYKKALLNRQNKKRIKLYIQFWQRRETPYISYSVPIGKTHV